MADSLVFDFPDPTPHFDFDNFSNGGGSAGGLSYSSREGATPASSSTPTTTTKKTSSKKSRALFKSRFMNKGSSNNNNSQQQQRPASPVPARSSQHIPNNGDDSPLNKSMGDQSGTTATTASMSVGSSNFSPNRLQYGNKHNNHNHMIGRTASSGSPKSSGAKTPTSTVAPPPPTSNNGRESPRFEFSLFDDPSPSPKSGMRKSLLSNKPNPYSNLTTTNLSSSNHQRNHSGDGNNLYTAYGLSSDRTAASGYISEVSEFSFDRVTVTTERTGMSSNVSWNFMEGSQQLGGGGGGVLGALGSNNNNGGGGSSKLKPPDIDKLLLDDDLLNGPNHHDSNGNRMNVFTGEIHERCDQSVISEISEGIDDDDGGGMDFINSILMEKYEDGDVVHHHQQHQMMQKGDGKGVGSVMQRRPSSPTQQLPGSNNRSTAAAAAAVPTSTTPLRKQSSNNNNTISTVSTSANNSGGGLSIVESAYGNYKQQQRTTTNTKKKTENRSLLKAIMEDIQFCGMYFCGLDTTVEDDGQLTDNKRDGSPSKKARAKEMDSTFLGKFVKCATCGPDS